MPRHNKAENVLESHYKHMLLCPIHAVNHNGGPCSLKKVSLNISFSLDNTTCSVFLARLNAEGS